MTDLYSAFNDGGYEGNYFGGGDDERQASKEHFSQQSQPIQAMQPMQPMQAMQTAGQQQVHTSGHAHQKAQQVVSEGFRNSPPYELKNYEKHVESQRRNPSYSFWDRMALKRPEVIKLGVFALVIVLAISLEKIGTHYLSKYLSDNIFTDLQELMLRFSYPIGIFIIIWIIKSL